MAAPTFQLPVRIVEQQASRALLVNSGHPLEYVKWLDSKAAASRKKGSPILAADGTAITAAAVRQT